MSLAYRIIYRVGLTPCDAEESEILGPPAGWQLMSARADMCDESTGPSRNVPRTWCRLVRA
ncbi:MAG: hypothetical protein JO286_26165 [Solirubrobacterales bacterium]|nr:hypothetical protein [Solirubrobacterales bacterium]MBV9367713.1 hypothetical protein [Solirubrobacterales bacterium]MBV9810690.1 hypothetical protein [Solirubrobacterales bacterium]